MLFISTVVGFASDCLVPSFSSAAQASDTAKMNAREAAKCQAGFMMASVTDIRGDMALSEVLHVLDQRPLIVIAKITSESMSAILDEVRTHVHFQEFCEHLLHGHVMVLDPQLRELFTRRAL